MPYVGDFIGGQCIKLHGEGLTVFRGVGHKVSTASHWGEPGETDTMTTWTAFSLTARCACTGHMSLRDVLRMAAYAVLAVQAAKEQARNQGGNAYTYKMHVGAMRGTYRRAKVRSMGVRAVALALGV